MDDLLYTGWSPDTMLERRSTGRKVLAEKYSMECQPSKSILGYDPEYHLTQSQTAPSISSTKPVKVLGYQWNLADDTLSVVLPDVRERPLRTRRDCFQTLGRYFDPLGIHIEAAARERWLLRQVAQLTSTRIVARQRTLNSSWTIARLELCGLLLAAELLAVLLEEFDLNAWRLRRSPKLDEKYLPKFELRRMMRLRKLLSDLSHKCHHDIHIGSISGAENPADNGTRPGMIDDPARMMPLSGMNIELILGKVKVVSTFSPTPTLGYDEVEDELDVVLSSTDVSANAVLDLQKDTPSLEPSEGLRQLLLDAQTADPQLRDILKKLKAADGVIDGYELNNGLIYRTCSVALDDSNRGSGICRQIVVPEVRRDLQLLVVKWVHDKHRGHPDRTTLTRWVSRSYYWKRLDRTVRVLNRECEGCQARRIAENRRRAQSSRPPGCSVKYEPLAIAYFDVMGPYQLSNEEDGDPKRVYVFTLSCHSSKFVKCEPAYSKSGVNAARALLRLLADEGPSRVLMVDQGLNIPEVLAAADEWDVTVIAAPPRGEELRGWGERAHRDVHAIIRGCLWDLAADHKLPSEDEFLRILNRAVTIVNMTPYVDGSPLCPFLVCRGHSRMIGDIDAKKEAEDIRKAIFDGLEPPSWWTEELAQLYRERQGEGRTVLLKELADVWWLRRRNVRERLMSRVKRHAGRDLTEGEKVYRWRPMLGRFGKLNTGWSPAVLVKKMSNSVCKVRLPDGKEVNESVLNLRPAGVCR
ncbi:hypothetical protein Pmar_PMAR019960 [Perkinsus marinus ATCC 50983]|uniref:Integrase catalytic domain-containing protein n=1 Tax=Perkinsus marinus (strain ATCC 50983 / TXsc) TaxID=423536 RepID=C5LJ67_PERM5|nr:hypothetical protein Pmar_PMAR019960 [Perkinsus marinus ATCC 50983]EER03183.1 hypothetical protein Pmar_PMAR019960 [Perkinsus marinus ATCC 50983]|eukprot:XP_002771367.1 hypothetical protein Pmar_PMAR019960 [Perkinsus marinus ATCC 50983]